MGAAVGAGVALNADVGTALAAGAADPTASPTVVSASARARGMGQRFMTTPNGNVRAPGEHAIVPWCHRD
jgi:hypothetical protein